MKVVAIIPAYNEERTVKGVVEALQNAEVIDEIVVVSDGSTDRTAEVARQSGARTIELASNIGKGGAMKIGIQNTDGDVYLFVDADLVGFRRSHVLDLVMPVIRGEADMTIGVFGKGRFTTDIAQQIAPFLSGQRAVRREILDKVLNLDIARYRVEVVLNRQAKLDGLKVKEVVLTDVTHRMKEEKLGFFKGFAARLKMYWQIASSTYHRD